MADISLVDVCKTYKGGQNAVKDFSLDIRDRELIIFVGPSGAEVHYTENDCRT